MMKFNTQVGINAVNPNASLEIEASNSLSPSNTDGLLVPRINTFPVINPTVNQNGNVSMFDNRR